MESPIKTVRISHTGKEQLNKLKRVTQIDRWNVLCRWALCLSLAESTEPSPLAIETGDGLEIAWDTFGGEIADILIIALKQRCDRDGLNTDTETLRKQFTLHLHRGLSYLAEDDNIDSIEKLIEFRN